MGGKQINYEKKKKKHCKFTKEKYNVNKRNRTRTTKQVIKNKTRNTKITEQTRENAIGKRKTTEETREHAKGKRNEKSILDQDINESLHKTKLLQNEG